MINSSGGFGSEEKPQENQFMGNTPSNPENNTSWMAPSTPESNYSNEGAQNPSNNQQQQTAPTQQPGGGSTDGTALSSAINGMWNQFNGAQPAGRIGQYMPEGYDTNKFSDTANANSLKYQVGRILSQYPPGSEGLQQAAGELSRLGISVLGRDKIRLPDGTTSDVGKSFSDPNAQHAWQYNWSGPAGGGNMQQQGNSMLGQQGQQGFQGGMDPNMIMGYLQQYMPGGSANQMRPQNQRQYDFSNYNTQMGGGIAQSQGDMIGGPMDQLHGSNVGMGPSQRSGGSYDYLPSGSMGIRAPGPDNPFANNPNVRF